MKVKRYDIASSGDPEEGAWMDESEHGDYVKASDYDALLAEARWAMEQLLYSVPRESTYQRAAKWLKDHPTNA